MNLKKKNGISKMERFNVEDSLKYEGKQKGNCEDSLQECQEPDLEKLQGIASSSLHSAL